MRVMIGCGLMQHLIVGAAGQDIAECGFKVKNATQSSHDCLFSGSAFRG
jgi:hypothetical protein